MSMNLISAAFKPEHKTAMQDLTQQMLVIVRTVAMGLDNDQRRELGVMGERSRTFAHQALDMVQHHGEIFPPSIEVDEFSRDLALHMDALEMARQLRQVLDMLEDTALVAGYDAYQHALAVYSIAKLVGAGAGLGERVEEMGRLFERRRKSAKADVPA